MSIQGQIELILPPEIEARPRYRVVADRRAWLAFGQVGGACAPLFWVMMPAFTSFLLGRPIDVPWATCAGR